MNRVVTNLILSKSLINSRAKPRYAFGEYMPARKRSVNKEAHNRRLNARAKLPNRNILED